MVHDCFKFMGYPSGDMPEGQVGVCSCGQPFTVRIEESEGMWWEPMDYDEWRRLTEAPTVYLEPQTEGSTHE